MIAEIAESRNRVRLLVDDKKATALATSCAACAPFDPERLHAAAKWCEWNRWHDFVAWKAQTYIWALRQLPTVQAQAPPEAYYALPKCRCGGAFRFSSLSGHNRQCLHEAPKSLQIDCSICTISAGIYLADGTIRYATWLTRGLEARKGKDRFDFWNPWHEGPLVESHKAL